MNRGLMMSDTQTPNNKPKKVFKVQEADETPQARAKKAYAVILRMKEINGKLRQMGVTSSNFAIKKVASN